MFVYVQVSPPTAIAQHLAKACAKAFAQKDHAWFDRHLAPGFFYQDAKGEREDRAAMLARLQRWFHPLLYRVQPSLSTVSAKASGKGLLLVSDLKVVSQPVRPWRTPITETTMRVDSLWLPKGSDWIVQRIVERSTRKLEDGKPVEP